MKAKLRVFNSNVMSVLLYACETCNNTKSPAYKSRVPRQNGVSQAWCIVEIHHSGWKRSKLHSFINRCYGYLLRIKWQASVTNQEASRRAGQDSLDCLIKGRKGGGGGGGLSWPSSGKTILTCVLFPITQSMVRTNRNGEKRHPWLAPVLTANYFELPL